MHMPPEQMQQGTFWQQDHKSPHHLGTKPEHVTSTSKQTPQLPNYKTAIAVKIHPPIVNIVIILGKCLSHHYSIPKCNNLFYVYEYS